MHKFPAILILGLLAFAGCSSDRNAAIFHPWGWEDTKDAKAHLDSYKHVLVARIDESHWEDSGPHPLNSYHFKATVVRTYKGDWRVSERIAFVHYVDYPARDASTSNAPFGDFVVVFSNEHTNAEIVLYTGEFRPYREVLAPALECIYPDRSR